MPGTDSSSCTQQDAYFFSGTFHTHKKGLAVTSRIVALFVCLISCIGYSVLYQKERVLH